MEKFSGSSPAIALRLNCHLKSLFEIQMQDYYNVGIHYFDALLDQNFANLDEDEIVQIKQFVKSIGFNSIEWAVIKLPAFTRCDVSKLKCCCYSIYKRL
jgi:hypothetical protein